MTSTHRYPQSAARATVSASGRAKKAAVDNATDGSFIAPRLAKYERLSTGGAARILCPMWLIAVVATVVAGVFAVMLFRQFAARRGQAQLLWSIAMAMFAVASAALAVGVASGWSTNLFAVYWAFGAVLNVPFLAGGELLLLFRRRWVLWATWLVLIFSVAFTFAVLRNVSVDALAIGEQLPSGKDVFGAGTQAHRLPQYFSYPAYFILLGGALWSAWKMRGRPELKDRFVGTLLIAVGATVVAGGATFAALGMLTGFVVTLLIGICVMFWGFLRASRPVAALAAPLQAADQAG
jgi:hypothetical protein